MHLPSQRRAISAALILLLALPIFQSAHAAPSDRARRPEPIIVCPAPVPPPPAPDPAPAPPPPARVSPWWIRALLFQVR